MVRRQRKSEQFHNVCVIGAGAAGVGIGVALKHAGIDDVVILDRHGVGASFERWPKEMTFLTPSFPTNSVGMLDLNAIAIGTSPAYSLGREHPSGQSYARYLRAVATYFELNVQAGTDVLAVEPKNERFRIATSQGDLFAQFLVWAAGEFQYPNRSPFPGAEQCLHSSTLTSFRDYSHNEAIVIGGYESGVDAAIQLGALQKKVTVLSRGVPWESEDSDPSVSISTYTKERLETVRKLGGQIELIGKANVHRVAQKGNGYEVRVRGKPSWFSPGPPILATGFQGSHLLISDLFESRKDGCPLLSDEDESTTIPGLFFCGPMVRHDDQIFCFIYKFRQRFAVVAKAIADRLGLPAEELETYRQWGMYLDDLSCCGEPCVC